MCSKKECELAIEALQPLKNIVVGLHLKSKGLLPSGEKFIDVANYLSKFDLSGITASCVNPMSMILLETIFQNYPYRMDLNLMHLNKFLKVGEPDGKNTSLLGKRNDITPDEFLKFVRNMLS